MVERGQRFFPLLFNPLLSSPSDGRPSRASTSVRAHIGPVRDACLVAAEGGEDDDFAAARTPPRLLTFSDATAAKLWTIDQDTASSSSCRPRPTFTASLLRGHANWVTAAHGVCAAGGGGGVAAATGGADGRLVLWSVAPGIDAPRPITAHVLTCRREGGGSVSAVRLRGGEGGAVAAAAAGAALSLCDARAPRPTLLADMSAPIVSLAWQPCASVLAVARRGGDVELVDVRTAARVTLATPHGASSAAAIAWSAGGCRLVTGGGDRRVTVWEAAPVRAPGQSPPLPRSVPPPPPHPPHPPAASLDALDGAIGRLATSLAALDARAAAAEAVARRVAGRAARCLVAVR